jgi:glucose/arabinose dehydrogenase
MIAITNTTDNFYSVRAQSGPQPNVTDPKLKIEPVASIHGFPTNMAFVGHNDILILSKNDGQVFRIKDGKNVGPVLKLNVTGKDEMGLLGIAVADDTTQNNSNHSKTIGKNQSGADRNVFLYYSYCSSKTNCNNFVTRYDWKENEGKLVNPKSLLKLPGLPGPSHVGGEIAIGPDGYIYLTVGDLLPTDMFNKNSTYDTQAQNYIDGPPPDGRAGILRITQDGKSIGNGTIGNSSPLNSYYAYGIKNSFGMGFDPVTGKLWDSENGPDFGDEINLIEPGTNSGWSKVQGFWPINIYGQQVGILTVKPDGLVDFEGKGKYHAPKLVWESAVGPTALIFLNSTQLGSQYLDDMFVGSVQGGSIFHMELTKNRTDLSLPTSLADRIVTKDKRALLLFAEGFEIVTDLQVGPNDGYLYVVSGDRSTNTGTIYRIIPQ